MGYLSGDPSRCVGAVLGIDLGLGTAWVSAASKESRSQLTDFVVVDSGRRVQ